MAGPAAPVGEIKAPQLLQAMRRIEARGAIESYMGMPITRAALQLAPLVFVRPGELRKAEWIEFDLDAAQWSASGARLDGRRDCTQEPRQLRRPATKRRNAECATSIPAPRHYLPSPDVSR